MKSFQKWISIGSTVLVGVIGLRWCCNVAGGVCKSSKRLDGYVVVITGATDGIGYETALELARRGARINMISRNAQKAQRVKEKIASATGADIRLYTCDLSELKRLKKVSDEIGKKEGKIDILINNAGPFVGKRIILPCGFEKTWVINTMAPFLLTRELLPHFNFSRGPSDPPRVVNVAVKPEYGMKGLDLDDINFESKHYNFLSAASPAKKALVMCSRQWSRLEKDVAFVSLHPGNIWSSGADEIFQLAPYGLRSICKVLAFAIFYPLSKTPLQGAQTTLHCCLDDDVIKDKDRAQVAFYADCQPFNYKSPEAQDLESCKAVWEFTNKALDDALERES